jgi:hypothetical protein
MQRLLKLRHYSPRTQRSYLGWVRRYLLYLKPLTSWPPQAADAQTFLSQLAIRHKVAASTQNCIQKAPASRSGPRKGA